MMLHNIFFKTLRDTRYHILIWGGGFGLLMFFYSQAYTALFAGPERDKLIKDYVTAFESMSFIAGKAYDVDTLGGFITAEFMIFSPLLFSIVAFLIGSNLIRGEEEKGSLDILLSTPHSRLSVFLQKSAGLTAMLLLIGGLAAVGLVAGAATFNLELSTSGAFLQMLNAIAVSLIFGNIALLFSQLGSRKWAIGWSGGLLAATYLLNSLSEVVDMLKWMRPLSPFHYYNLSKPLCRSVGMDWMGLIILLVVSIPLVIAAAYMYLHRDHSGVFQLFPQKALAENNHRSLAEPKAPWLAGSFWFALKSLALGALIWGVGIASYTVLILAIFNNMKDSMLSLLQSDFYKAIGFMTMGTNENLLNLMLFLFLVVLFASYAVTMVASWANDETEGRLELLLATPQARWRLLLSRFTASLIAMAFVVGLNWLVFEIMLQVGNVKLVNNYSMEAFAGAFVLGGVILAFGFLFCAFKPGWTMGVLTGLVIISFLIEFLKATFKFPDWVVDTSLFHHYGQPIISGLDWTVQYILLGLCALFVGIAITRFHYRDIES
ncbi:MAG: ABC transporter permease subunit [Chloroflexi bacterium]|uniref:ABC transporter permease subunit n=1 Tax=Candidatus Chlorohelix allophototropha TaxID=3003348 RepID=A0A8T7M6S9_9CHLR|nr:ABC transporter permease subunit [Chloroflexota bacterium]WJW69759.1 ABC transporter permease subunit [Chloroflexota bacterium L227-S17]